MFFVFTFLLVSIYVSETNNFVLKDARGPNFNQNVKDLIFQGIDNGSSIYSTRNSILWKLARSQNRNPIIYQFNKRLSEDIPIKRHIQENDEEDISSMFKNTKSSIATSARELNRKWPVVELLTHSDDLNENEQYFDDFEKKELPLSLDVERESTAKELSPKHIDRHIDLQNNHSKIKPVGLRSLYQQKFPGINCQTGDQCVCRLPSKTGTSKPTTALQSTVAQPPSSMAIDMGFPLGIPMGVPVGVPMGIPAGYPAGYPSGYPAAYPAVFQGGPMPCAPGLPSYYQPNTYNEVPKHKKPSKTRPDDYVHYDGDDDEKEYVYSYDDDSFGKKRKHEKQHKGEILVDVKYDVEESHDRKRNRHVGKCRHDQKDEVTDIFKDKIKSQSDTLIKDCYCCAASSCGVNFRIVLLLVILVTFCQVSLTTLNDF